MAETSAPASSVLRQGPQTFSGFSRWSRTLAGDDDSSVLRASIGRLSEHIEKVIAARRGGLGADAVKARVRSLTLALAEHQHFLSGMSSAWNVLYEFAHYQRALRDLAALVARWQQQLAQRDPAEKLCFATFETHAWHTLGDGVLLIDMYERSASSQRAEFESTQPTHTLQSGWRARLRRWWSR